MGAYFPFFIDLEGREGLIIGGGTVALRKLQKLLPYGPRLTVTAPEILPEIEQMPEVTVLRQTFTPDLLEGKYFAIAATDDRAANRAAAAECRRRGVLVNTADDKAYCDFLFPALVKRGPLSIGVSTGGASPSAAAWVKRRIAGEIPENFGPLLHYLESLRPAVRERIPDGARRSEAYARLFTACMETGFPLEESALAEALTGAPESTVYLVGAGCGGADLITVRGLRLLERCAAVVYDDLIAPELLDAAPEQAERIYAGKRQGLHSTPQEDINALLIAKAREGRGPVVRLKGGDPFVFGRGGEEALALEAAGIPWEYVPGVTSAVAVPGGAGIPVTHRGASRSVHIITAHTAGPGGGLPPELDKLARLKEGTLIFLMGLSRLEALANRLLEAGMPPETPAAVISGENAPRPMAVRGTLADIAAKVEEAGMKPPAVIAVGGSAGMRLS